MLNAIRLFILKNNIKRIKKLNSLKQLTKQENAIRCNNRDDLLYLTLGSEISKFSEAFI